MLTQVGCDCWIFHRRPQLFAQALQLGVEGVGFFDRDLAQPTQVGVRRIGLAPRLFGTRGTRGTGRAAVLLVLRQRLR